MSSALGFGQFHLAAPILVGDVAVFEQVLAALRSSRCFTTKTAGPLPPSCGRFGSRRGADTSHLLRHTSAPSHAPTPWRVRVGMGLLYDNVNRRTS